MKRLLRARVVTGTATICALLCALIMTTSLVGCSSSTASAPSDSQATAMGMTDDHAAPVADLFGFVAP